MQKPETQTPALTTPKFTRKRRQPWWAIFLLVMALVAFFPVRAGLAGYQSYRTLRQLATQLRQVDHPAALTSVQPLVQTLRTDLARLQRALLPLRPVLRGLGFVPRIGPSLAVADRLALVGEQVATIADRGLTLIDAAGMSRNDQPSAGWGELGPVLAPLHGDLVALEELTEQLVAEAEGRKGARELANVHGAVTLATFATELGPLWPQLLGNTRPATYLVLIQNNHELRATGGFISALAPVTLVNGAMQPVEFADSYAAYSPHLAYPPAPAPMRTYMEIELLTLRDANWSANLPTAATVIRTLYQQQTELAVDGVITVDLDAVAYILPAFERLTLAGTDISVEITAANVEEALVQLWNNPLESDAVTSATGEGDWWRQRKDFMGQLAATLFRRIQQRAVDPLALAGGVVKGLDRRAIQLWFFDRAAQPPLVARQWDGALHPESQADYVAVIDSNVGYNKANAVVTRALNYHVTWPAYPVERAVATLTITYTHPVERDDPVCRPESYYGTRYEEMIARCYFNYSRVYVPAGSELLSVEGWLGATVNSERGEQGTQQFAGYFVLTPGTSHQVTLRYALPAALQSDAYTLVVQRQAGTDPLPVQIEIDGVSAAHTLTGNRWLWHAPSP